ncbi:MAG: hypothetical protein EOP53_00990 [Sphingobacteriales bacterium]|nr:MAG: hypothetical protein EOP53_00990 [Sphingobacteriales bacterium]
MLIVMMLFLATSNLFAAPKMKRICAAKNGVNTVYWFKFQHSCEAYQSTYIYARENAFATYKLIATVTDENQLTFDHLNASTFQSGSYFIKINLICANTATEFISDTINVDVTPPAVMDPDSVSVGPDGEINVGWTPSTAPDIKNYTIYRTQGTNNTIINNTITGTFYQDKINGDGSLQAEKYRIAPADSCGNIAPIGNFHQTMFLNISQDKCASEVYLKWSPYEGWKDGIERYDIYYSTEKYFKYTKLGEANKEEFTGRFLPNKTNLYFLVRAIRKGDNSVTSSSNRLQITTDFEDSTQFLYLSKVSFIKNTDKIRLDWFVTGGHNYVYFDIYRGKAPGTLVKVDRVSASARMDYDYTETEPDKNFVWYYKVIGFSNCGRKLGESAISNNIKLTLNYNPLSRTLYWNNYIGWPTNVEGYEVYRSTTENGVITEDLLMKVDNDSTSYRDDELTESDAAPGICYYVKAIENIKNPYGFKEESISNYACYSVPPIVYIPNVFYPDGIYNKVFLPKVLYADTLQSTFSIYNRWGEKIVSDVQVWRGWDGVLPNGSKAPDGVYFYRLQVIGIDKSSRLYSSTITLLR